MPNFQDTFKTRKQSFIRNFSICMTLPLRGIYSSIIEKQSFADVLQNRYSQKFRKFHRKTPVLESLFSKVGKSPLRKKSIQSTIKYKLSLY